MPTHSGSVEHLKPRDVGMGLVCVPKHLMSPATSSTRFDTSRTDLIRTGRTVDVSMTAIPIDSVQTIHACLADHIAAFSCAKVLTLRQ
jgi:hypothetical protein